MSPRQSPASLRLVRDVPWRDLVPMRRGEGIAECLHPLPWLAGSLTLAQAGNYAFAAPLSFMFFLTALRLNHEAIHRHLGFGAAGHRRVIHALSALMLGSNSAISFNHLRHHAHAGRREDVEGKCGQMSGFRVLLYGPLFPFELWSNAWRLGGRDLRRGMAVDLALNLCLVGLALGSAAPALLYHIAAMAAAQCLTAFFAVWITHHGCHGEDLVARSQRSALVNFASYNMFLHLEHHLFPAVPVKRLGRLARRIDALAPDIAGRIRRVL